MPVYKIAYMADARADEAKEIAEDLGGKVYTRNTKTYTGEWIVRFKSLKSAEVWAKDFDICHWGNRSDIMEIKEIEQ